MNNNFERIFADHIIIENVNSSRATVTEAKEFKELLDEDILLNENDIIVDLTNCQQIDSTFLGVLVMAMKKLKLKNRKLILVDPKDENCRNALSMMGTYLSFEVQGSRENALNFIARKKQIKHYPIEYKTKKKKVLSFAL